MLKRDTSDIDIACQEPAKSLAAKIANRTGGTLVTLDDSSKVYRVVVKDKGLHFDVAQIQGRDIGEDLLRRDFTINAMALPLTPNPLPEGEGRVRELLDPRQGLHDLKQRIIRADRPKVFVDDPLRMLRAFRLAAQLEFRIDNSTYRHIREHRLLIQKSAGERIRQELMTLLSVSPSHPWVQSMEDAGLLTAIFPILEDSRTCAEVYYGKGGVLKHTLLAVERADLILSDLDRIFPDIAKNIRRHFESQGANLAAAAPLIRLAVLLHDIAKPATARQIDGRLRFFEHEAKGAQMAEDILRKLRFSGQEIQSISSHIRHHLRPGNLAANPVISDKAVFRFFDDLGPDGVGLALVCWADHSSYLTPAQLSSILPNMCKDPHTFPFRKLKDGAIKKTLKHIQVLHYLLKNYFERPDRIVPKPVLNGNEIMKVLRIKPGPRVGKILSLLQEAQAEGKVSNPIEGAEFIQKLSKKIRRRNSK